MKELCSTIRSYPCHPRHPRSKIPPRRLLPRAQRGEVERRRGSVVADGQGPRGLVLLNRLRGVAEVGLHLPHALGKHLLGVGIGHRGDDDAILPLLPVRRSGQLMGRGQLQGIDDPQDLGEIAAGARRVGEGELDLLVRPDDEDRAHGGLVVGIGVDHVVGRGHLALFIGDDREIHGHALGLVDVADPLVMLFHRVHADRDHLHIALLKVRLDPRDRAQLGGADRGEIRRMRKEDAPGSAEPLMKIDDALGGGGGEVGSDVAESEGHVEKEWWSFGLVDDGGVKRGRASGRESLPEKLRRGQREICGGGWDDAARALVSMCGP